MIPGAEDDPLLTNRQAAAEMGVSLNTFYVMLRERKAPPAYYVRPKAPRWLRSELRAAKEGLPRGYPDQMKANIGNRKFGRKASDADPQR
jgi:predicted DNA-binding transcriptional regulator AlpA